MPSNLRPAPETLSPSVVGRLLAFMDGPLPAMAKPGEPTQAKIEAQQPKISRQITIIKGSVAEQTAALLDAIREHHPDRCDNGEVR